MRASLTIVALSIAACSPSRVSIQADLDALLLPPSGMVLVALVPDEDGLPVRIFKHVLPATPRSIATFHDIEGSPSVIVARYAEDSPYLADGELSPLASAEPGSLPLPVPNRSRGERVYRAALSEDELEPWIEEPALPRELLELRFSPQGCPCVELRARLHALGNQPSRDDSGVAVALSEDRALVSNRLGEFFTLDAAGLTTLELPANLPNLGALRTEAGVVWLFGREGRVARTSTATELGFVYAPPDPRGTNARRAVSVETERGTVIYTYGGQRLSAFDGERWLVVHTESTADTWQVDLHATSPTEVWTVNGNRDTLNRIYDIELDFEAGTASAKVEEVRVTNSLGQNFSTLGFAPGIGLVVGAQGFGEIFAGDEGGFRQLPSADEDLRSLRQDPSAPTRLGARAYDLVPLESGFLGVGALGTSVQYHPGFGFCNFDRISTDSMVKLVNVGRDLVVLTENTTRPSYAIYISNHGRARNQALCEAAPN